jgi:hypothetical protein
MGYYYQKKLKKGLFLLGICLTLTFLIGYIFYLSEPRYVDDIAYIKKGQRLERYDYVSLPKYNGIFSSDGNIENGLVLQVDSAYALVLMENDFMRHDNYVQLKLKDHKYRLVGKGTIYHKVNHFIGFNIFMLTEIGLLILTVVLYVTTISTLISVLKEYM